LRETDLPEAGTKVAAVVADLLKVDDLIVDPG
jgi:hypothetical protein